MSNQKSTKRAFNLHRNQVAHACLTMVLAATAPGAFAAAGFGDTNDANGDPIRAQTYYAHSPNGVRSAIPPEAVSIMGNTYTGNTGAALRKFVDTLPQIGAKTNKLADGVTSKYIPKAVPVKWKNPAGVVTGDDYYEIAVVEYTEKLHSDLLNPTRIRGYVQIDHLASNGLGQIDANSKKVALFYPLKAGQVTADPIMIPATDVNGKLTGGAAVQALAYDDPHYMGPAIEATRGVATRLKFHNLLPVGRYDAATGRNGDLFLPVDETLAGAGVGPDGVTRYTQNRANMHLHGGDTPWISDGTPHQWIAPAGEREKLTTEMSAAGSPLPVDTFMRGPGALNVPDMNNPGDGAMTYYFPNRQSARMMWYHDHSYGLTRLNVYAGMVAPFVLKDEGQDTLLKQVPGFPADTIHMVIQDKTFVPEDIKLQDGRWNAKVIGGVNKPLTTPLWGEASDMWYPHVYEVNQDPSNGLDGTNPVGRWDWGPYFWPVFPALYNLPTGGVDDVTLTPEAWMDTPVVNGVAYPTLTVEPRAQRFKILNGSNDRFWNLSFFLADSAISEILVPAGQGGSGYKPTDTVTINSTTGTGATAELVLDAAGSITAIRVTNAGTGYSSVPGASFPTLTINTTTGSGATPQVVVADSTEVKMVPAAPIESTGLPACALDANDVDVMDGACWPSSWPTDGRTGGVPDPRTIGPKIYQIGTEGGLLPAVAEINPNPMQYEYNRRSITVLNAWATGLFMGNAERADILVDFSPYAGKTLILYSDAPAPVPAFDPRNDHWTGKPDETSVGSVETPKAGFGPNTRTVMQIKVVGTAGTPLDVPALKTKLSEVYGDPVVGQEKPIVAQSTYNAAFGQSWSDSPQADGTKAFATIFTGSLQEPTFKFTPGTPNGGFDKIVLATGIDPVTGLATTLRGSGYRTPPVPVIAPPPAGGVQATAATTLRVDKVNIANAGAGYKFAPVVTFGNTGAGTGAVGLARMQVAAVQIAANAGGTGYDPLHPPAVTFSAPDSRVPNGIQATGTAVVDPLTGAVTGVTMINRGNGYTSAPLVAFAVSGNGSRAAGTTTLNIRAIDLVSNDPNHPEFAGGGGYSDMSLVTVAITPPTGPGAIPAVATVTGSVSDITLTNSGKGYLTQPIIAIPAPMTAGGALIPGGVAAQAVAAAGGGSILVKNKAIQELFDPTYGRMNATLGIEIPFTSALTQTTIPLGYVDPLTEEFSDGETQIWKITHNGVDGHPVHFHLLNVQVINRVGWDGTIKPPHANEYGWKETVLMNPLEDIVVAVRAKKPVLPGFGLPLSKRLRDPSQPDGVPMGFTQINAITGNPDVVTNKVDDFGWEYVWHCHILGHEENDFMRPIKFNANEAVPLAPTSLSLNRVAGVDTLTWNDESRTEYEQELHVLKNTPAGLVDTATGIKFLANANKATITRVANAVGYGVAAVGAAGSKTGWYLNVGVGRPGNQTATMLSASSARFSWRDNSNNETSFIPQISSDGGATWTAIDPASPEVPGSVPPSATLGTFSTVATGLVPEVSYQFRVFAKYVLNADYSSTSGVSNTATAIYVPPVAPTVPLATVLPAAGSARFSWIDFSGDENFFRAEISGDGGVTWNPVNPAQPLTPTLSVGGRNYRMNVTATGLVSGVNYQFRVYSVRTGFGESKTAATASLLYP